MASQHTVEDVTYDLLRELGLTTDPAKTDRAPGPRVVGSGEWTLKP